MVDTELLKLWMLNAHTKWSNIFGFCLVVYGLIFGLAGLWLSPIAGMVILLAASFGLGMLTVSYRTQKIAFSRSGFLKTLLEEGYVGLPAPDGSLIFASTFSLDDPRATEMRVVIGVRKPGDNNKLMYIVGTYENLKDWMWRVEVKSSANIRVWGLRTPVWEVLKQLVVWWPLLSPSTVTDSGNLGELLEKSIVEKARIAAK